VRRPPLYQRILQSAIFKSSGEALLQVFKIKEKENGNWFRLLNFQKRMSQRKERPLLKIRSTAAAAFEKQGIQKLPDFKRYW
jgi:hypothetical protein